MRPLPITDLENLNPLIEEMIAELKIGARTSVEYTRNFATLVTNSGGGVFVDDVTSPSYFLILSSCRLGIADEQCCFVNAVYSVESKRGAATNKDLSRTIESFARLHGCATIIGASGRLPGATNSDNFWEQMGCRKQETLFVKPVK